MGTANSLSTLTLLGITKVLELEIPFEDGRRLKFQVKPQVIADLSDNVNLGANFLKAAEANLSFSSTGIILTFPSNHPQPKAEAQQRSVKGRGVSGAKKAVV